MATAGTAETATDRERLIALVRQRSYRKGQFTLASGRTSPYYVNLKPTMMQAEGAHLIGKLVLDALEVERESERVDYVGGLEMGAVPIASVVAALSHSAGRPVSAFFVRKAAKDHGTKSLVEGLSADESLRGKRLVVLEDVTTTGGSALKAVAALQAEGAVIARVLTIVDRQEGAAEAFAAAGVPFGAILTLADLDR